MRRKRVLSIGLLILALIAVSVWIIIGRNKSYSTSSNKPNTYVVRRGDLSITVSGNGILEPERSLDIVSRVSGTVIYVIEEGRIVREGEILVRLDQADYQNSYKQALISYQNAKINYDQVKLNYETQKRQLIKNLQDAQISQNNANIEVQNAKRNLERMEELYKKGVASQNDLENARYTYEKAKNSLLQAETNYNLLRINYDNEIKNLEKQLELSRLSLEKAQIDLDNAKRNLENTIIRAPFSGIVTGIKVVKGQLISANATLLTLINTQNMYLNLEVDETDIGKVSIGLPVKISLDAFPDEEFKGEVVSISPIATISNNIPIFKVKVRISNPDGRLKAGMSADGDIILVERKNVLLVPLKAVQRTERRSYVELLKADGTREMVRITLGEEDGNNVVVESGLKEGDVVILPSSATSSTSNTQRSGQLQIRIPGIPLR